MTLVRELRTYGVRALMSGILKQGKDFTESEKGKLSSFRNGQWLDRE